MSNQLTIRQEERECAAVETKVDKEEGDLLYSKHQLLYRKTYNVLECFLIYSFRKDTYFP